MAHISARSLKRLSQIRRPGLTLLKENCRQNERFEERKILICEDCVDSSFGFPGDSAGLKERTVLQEGFDSHTVD